MRRFERLIVCLMAVMLSAGLASATIDCYYSGQAEMNAINQIGDEVNASNVTAGFLYDFNTQHGGPQILDFDDASAPATPGLANTGDEALRDSAYFVTEGVFGSNTVNFNLSTGGGSGTTVEKVYYRPTPGSDTGRVELCDITTTYTEKVGAGTISGNDYATRFDAVSEVTATTNANFVHDGGNLTSDDICGPLASKLIGEVDAISVDGADGPGLGEKTHLGSFRTTVPTLSEWGLIALGILLAGSAVYLIMRRRSAAGAAIA